MQTTPDDLTMNNSSETINAKLEAYLQERRNHTPVQTSALPEDPDALIAMAMAAVLGKATALPAPIFEELARRNAALQNAGDYEIRATLARQVSLLEAVVARQMTKAVDPSLKPSAADTYMKSALQAQRVLLQVLSALYQMNRDTKAGAAPAIAPSVEVEVLEMDRV